MDVKVQTALNILGFKQVSEVPKMKHITKRFHKLALINHPDKGGNEELFKNISEAYRLIGEYIEKQKNINLDDDESFDYEEDVAMKTFEQFKANVKQNMKSFTIHIDNSSSYTWELILTKHYGPPMDKKSNGLHWKVQNYSDGNFRGNITNYPNYLRR